MKEKFTSNIRKLRKEFNVSQPQLAKEIGYSKNTISLWEIGTRIPCADAIIILSRYFQVSTDYILKMTDDNTMLHRIDDFEVDMSTFTKTLKELRLKKNISQDTLSDKTGLSQSAIGNWEIGKSIPTANAIIALARYFEVTTDYLLGESD